MSFLFIEGMFGNSEFYNPYFLKKIISRTLILKSRFFHMIIIFDVYKPLLTLILPLISAKSVVYIFFLDFLAY